jgi:hypothetical protein
MPENGDAAANAQAANDSQAQAASATGTQADPTPPNESSSVSLEDLKKIQRENQSLRARLKAVDDAKAAEEAAKLSEHEKTQKALTDATEQIKTLKSRIAQQAAQLEAAKLGIVDPEVAATLIQSKLELDDDGAPTNAGDLLAALLKEKPYLKATAEPTQQQPPRAAMSATNAGRGSSAGPTYEDLRAGKFTPQQTAQMWADGTMEKLLSEHAARNK